jgi:hypothetical protein
MTDQYFVTALWGIPFFSFITAGAGAYLGGYLKKRGENLATKDDFKDLREQTRQLTEATKQVEATISNEVWDRQRQWELKRDVLLEAARCVADVDAMLIRVDAVLKVKSQESGASASVESFFIDKKRESTQALNDADNALTRSTMAVAVVGSVKVRNSFNIMLGVLRSVSAKVLADGAVDQYAAGRADIQRALDNLVVAIRAELMATSI